MIREVMHAEITVDPMDVAVNLPMDEDGHCFGTPEEIASIVLHFIQIKVNDEPILKVVK